MEEYDVPEYVLNEQNWQKGFHVTQDEKIIKLTDMSTEHIKNCISYFGNKNVKPLIDELESRNN